MSDRAAQFFERVCFVQYLEPHRSLYLQLLGNEVHEDPTLRAPQKLSLIVQCREIDNVMCVRPNNFLEGIGLFPLSGILLRNAGEPLAQCFIFVKSILIDDGAEIEAQLCGRGVGMGILAEVCRPTTMRRDRNMIRTARREKCHVMLVTTVVCLS